MTPEFPSYVTTAANQAELAFWCPIELVAWRAARSAHLSALDVGQSRWLELAVAHEALHAAYRNALAYAEVQDLEARTGMVAGTEAAA